MAYLRKTLPGHAGVTISIDASDLQRVARAINVTAGQTDKRLKDVLTMAANRMRAELEETAPRQASERDRARHPLHLYQSFIVTRSSALTREIVTKEPDKYTWVTQGTAAPTAGTGYIFPRVAKHLWWPGIMFDKPVKWVSNHPGLKPNPFADRVADKYVPGNAATLGSTNWVAGNISDWFVQTLTNHLNGNAIGGMAGANLLRSVVGGGVGWEM